MYQGFIAALIAVGVIVTAGCQHSTPAGEVGLLAEPPRAEARPSSREYHGVVLHDDYLWLKDQSYPVIDDEDILEYLERENQWFAQQMAPREALVSTLFEEMKARVQEDEASVPWEYGAYSYRWRFPKGAQYRLWERRPIEGGDYVTILDEAREAGEQEFFNVGNVRVSPNDRFLAWTVDETGSERYRLIVDDLQTGERFSQGPVNVRGQIVWAGDSRHIYYAAVEGDTWRTTHIKRHVLGRDSDADSVVYHNPDKTMFMGIDKSQSEQYLFVTLGDRNTSEVRYLSLTDASPTLKLVASREEGVLYTLDHGNGQFYVLTNDEHINFRLATAPEDDPDRENWVTLLPPSDDVYLKGVSVFSDFIALQEMSDALSRIRVRTHAGVEHYVDFPESVYTSSLGNNPSYEVEALRIDYQSLTSPPTVFDYTVHSKALEKRWQRVIPSGYDKSLYTTERVWASARDGVRVPVSLVYKKGTSLDGSAPMYLYGYGAYGAGLPPYFSASRLSMLDRDVVFALAHVRGGDELGYQWYLDGKLEKRTNSFNDFVDVARYLIEQGYSSAGNIAIAGGSAGGELVGAAVIQAPDLWGAAVLKVPFVDVLNTMLDDSLPLTPPEWQEWGNPLESAEAFDFIRSYSPYDNISAQDYPPMLVTAGLNDPRVTYWEPAKWTAKMRALKTDQNQLLLKTNMGAGHLGQTGRYDRIKDFAEEIAFVFVHLGIGPGPESGPEGAESVENPEQNGEQNGEKNGEKVE